VTIPPSGLQTTCHVLMVRPRAFAANRQTASSNVFQLHAGSEGVELHERAVAEVDALANRLAARGVDPVVFDDTDLPHKPDAVFPNNWVSFHSSGRVVLYPMLAPNRRAERRADILAALSKRAWRWGETVDLTDFESRHVALEGTGSLVLDRTRRIAFAALSSRTRRPALAEFERRTGYRSVAFHTLSKGQPVYHTNVMLALGCRFAVVCAAAIDDPGERQLVLEELEAAAREVISIDTGQMGDFAANLLELDAQGNPLIALSTRALAAFTAAQRRRLEACGELLAVPLPAVEAGGGSLRCMLAEIFPPRPDATAR
jgi:hypothetical protein